MRRQGRLVILFAALLALGTWAESVAAQHHPVRRHGVVFVGGYFYDPFFGPYPWWPYAAYPYPYFPTYDSRAVVRLLVTPKEAAVSVDGFYAGIVDDFNGFFEGLPLPPGGHEIDLYMGGYRTVHQRIYLSPASTFKLHHTMERLPAGEVSEPPTPAPPIPPPPDGTYTWPRTKRGLPPMPNPPEAVTAAGYGTLSLHVQPPNADVCIDGETWTMSDRAPFLIQLSAGPHRVEVFKDGYRPYVAEIHLHEAESMPLNVSLTPEGPLRVAPGDRPD
jgi:hypothetical protein